MRVSTKFGMTVLGALAISASTLSAQAARPTTVSFHPSVSAGIAMPTGDTKDGMKTGYTVNGGIDLDMGMPVAWRAEVGYSHFEADGIDGSLSDFSGRANAVFKIPGAVLTPYFIGGVGMYRVKATVDCSVIDPTCSGTDISNSENKFGWNVGAGVDLPLGALASRIEARYHSVSMDGGTYTYLPVTFGIRF